MAMDTKLLLILLLSSLIALFSACLAQSAQGTEIDPELKTCKHQCRQQQQYSESDERKCLERCDRYHRMKEEREREIEEEVRRRKEHEMEETGSDDHHRSRTESKEEEECEEEEEEGNPFVFGDEQFERRVETEDGTVRVLQKFTEKSKLLRGIENFRFAVLEAQQHSFVSPCHFDSELVIFTVKGRATIGLVGEDKTERFNLEQGDIMRIPSGTPFYIVNRDENEKLLLAQLHITISIPGHFEAFYGPGGRDPESVLRAFSWDVLEAALKGQKENLERLFGRQKKGSIFRISRDQVRSLSKRWEGPRIWPFGGQGRGPFNIFHNKPSVSNDYGRLYEVGPEDQSDLDNLNLMISFANITNGSMSAPLYYTKAIKIGMVTEGIGEVEVVTPHMSEEQQKRKKSSPRYRRVSGRLRPGVVFVVPAGHPFVTMASRESNLQILCFEVNARGNKRLAFAGKRNIVKAMDGKAKELAFMWAEEKLNAAFSREEDTFFPGPQNHEEEEEEEEARRAEA
ncbi:vicilin Cor a 11.0101-like [Prosopis cineraria]|uniref:vicilin Cor a 11.0101-like n=1 Tax=Prosopis cineraria TaxID=364024 RepID=UPI0024107B56|nr:vicilin Cor a 11.0101-like [Prosopis cineraria]